MTKRRRSLCIVHYAFCIAAFAALAAKAITQAEWEADNSLIPTPSASSVFYVVEPTAFAGAQTVTEDAAGLDSTPTERIYDLDFETRFSTRPICTVLFLR